MFWFCGAVGVMLHYTSVILKLWTQQMHICEVSVKFCVILTILNVFCWLLQTCLCYGWIVHWYCQLPLMLHTGRTVQAQSASKLLAQLQQTFTKQPPMCRLPKLQWTCVSSSGTQNSDSSCSYWGHYRWQADPCDKECRPFRHIGKLLASFYLLLSHTYFFLPSSAETI